jgi:hypothetical protein
MLNLARLGEVDAINTALNYVIQDLGCTARVVVTNDIAEVILKKESNDLEKEICSRYIHKFFDYLQIPSITKVIVYANHFDCNTLIWWSDSYVELIPFPSNIDDVGDASNIRKYVKPITTTSVVTPLSQIPTSISFEHLPQALKNRLRFAGLRAGETRSWQDTKQIYEMIPENIRRQGIDAIEQYKRTHDWSHKKAYAQGGSSSPNNGDWENPSINRARGSRDITKPEAEALTQAKAQINFQSGSNIVLTKAATAGFIGFGVEFAFSGLENFVSVQCGEKSVEAALCDTLANSTSVAIGAAVVTGGVVALSLTFPPVSIAVGAVAPFLQIVGVASCIDRFIGILSRSNKVVGMDKFQEMMASYGIDQVELEFRELEIDQDFERLKTKMLRVT